MLSALTRFVCMGEQPPAIGRPSFLQGMKKELSNGHISPAQPPSLLRGLSSGSATSKMFVFQRSSESSNDRARLSKVGLLSECADEIECHIVS